MTRNSHVAWPRPRRDPPPRNIHVPAAAAPRPASAEDLHGIPHRRYPDAAIRAQASGEATGVVLATSSVISGLHYRYLFAATNAKAFTADAAYLYDGAPAPAPAKAVYFEANTTASPKVFDSIDVPATDKSTFVLYPRPRRKSSVTDDRLRGISAS